MSEEVVTVERGDGERSAIPLTRDALAALMTMIAGACWDWDPWARAAIERGRRRVLAVSTMGERGHAGVLLCVDERYGTPRSITRGVWVGARGWPYGPAGFQLWADTRDVHGIEASAAAAQAWLCGEPLPHGLELAAPFEPAT